MTVDQQNASLAAQLHRIKQDFAQRQAIKPMSHSVAMAYRQVIANYERITKSSSTGDNFPRN